MASFVGVITTRGFELAEWQQKAVDAWASGDGSDPWRGTLEIFTGGGKTLIALACLERASKEAPNLKGAVVVPTEALARQWIGMIERFTSLSAADIGLLGARGDSSLADVRVLVTVVNTAARELPAMVADAEQTMLIVDECHRAGAPTFSKVLDTPARFRLGLSATPDREELDDHGEPLTFDEQAVGQKLGSVVFRFTLQDARKAGWLPEYEIHHHAVHLHPEEAHEYDRLSRDIEKIEDDLKARGLEPFRSRALVKSKDDSVARLANAWLAKTGRRKDLLYRAKERHRVSTAIVRRAFERGEPRALLFHERIDEAIELFEELRSELGEGLVALEHSQLADRARLEALERFRSGDVRVLVSVKSLTEGIDVPDADLGLSVASASSVRQRIQTLGRVLRRTDDSKKKEMHVLYVADTVDEVIYGLEDWSDLTGEDVNHYWEWPFESGEPAELDGPPREPKPTEEQEWERIGRKVPEGPVGWLGMRPRREYSVDTRGNVTNALGQPIANPQGVAAMVEKVRGRPGGRFWVTPTHHLVIVSDTDGGLWIAGQLDEPFGIAATEGEGDVDLSQLGPGDPYAGPQDDERGTFKLSQAQGGRIERNLGGGRKVFAIVDESAGAKGENAHRVIDAWRQTGESGMTFKVNSLGHAWYRSEGEARFLAEVPEGFAWPQEGG